MLDNPVVQLKACDKIKTSADGNTIRFRIARKDIRLWQDEPFPVYLVVFDAKTEKALADGSRICTDGLHACHFAAAHQLQDRTPRRTSTGFPHT
jgi:hypothetical protein